MEQEAIRFSLSQLGIPVVPWDDSVAEPRRTQWELPPAPLVGIYKGGR